MRQLPKLPGVLRVPRLPTVQLQDFQVPHELVGRLFPLSHSLPRPPVDPGPGPGVVRGRWTRDDGPVPFISVVSLEVDVDRLYTGPQPPGTEEETFTAATVYTRSRISYFPRVYNPRVTHGSRHGPPRTGSRRRTGHRVQSGSKVSSETFTLLVEDVVCRGVGCREGTS